MYLMKSITSQTQAEEQTTLKAIPKVVFSP